jgi:phosphate transport system substrate-binding protein
LKRAVGPRSFLVVGLLAALALAITACGGGSAQGGEEVSGNISIEGSSTVQPITQAAAELFANENRGARIQVGGAGTSDGFEAFCKGDTQISTPPDR